MRGPVILSCQNWRAFLPRKDKFCLVVPPSIFLLDERVFVNLGILRVAACLERAGHPVEVLDLSGVSNYLSAARAHFSSTDSKWIGMTATTPQMPAAMEVLGVLREELGNSARVVLGGPHVTLVCAAAKMEDKAGTVGRASKARLQLTEDFDFLVAGDGEDAVFSLFQEGCPQIVDADDPKGGLFMNNARYEEIPFPARHLIDMASYHYAIDGFNATSCIAQLGCPFACQFCSGRNSPMLRRVRTRSTENILQELEHIHRTYGHTGFMFYDDELNVSKTMVELMDGITRLQERLGVEFRLRGFVKAELFTQEQGEAMRRAGFRWLLTGFESGAPRILENIQKKATREDNERVFDISSKCGLKVKALMSIGHAGETRETVEQTRDWLLHVKPDDFDVTIITTYPGSPYYDSAVETSQGVWTYTSPKTGDRLHTLELDYRKVADYYKGIPGGGYRAYVYTDDLTSDDLVSLRDDVESNVRGRLGIPFNSSAPAIAFEHSMGQSGPLPSNILRTSDGKRLAPGSLRLNVIR